MDNYLPLPNKQEDPKRDRTPDITEIEQVKDVVFRHPKHDGNSLKDCQHHDGHDVFLHCMIPF